MSPAQRPVDLAVFCPARIFKYNDRALMCIDHEYWGSELISNRMPRECLIGRRPSLGLEAAKFRNAISTRCLHVIVTSTRMATHGL